MPSRPRKPPQDPNEPIPFPGIVVIDTREQNPFEFSLGTLRADTDNHGRPWRIATRRGTLREGDYSLMGYEHRVALERKSAADLFNTIGQGRDRFERELSRLNTLDVAGVVCEADWHQILTEPPPHSKLKPKIVFRSVIAWQQRYPRVHWWMMPSRRLAEVTTFRILERFLKDIRRISTVENPNLNAIDGEPNNGPQA